MPQSYMTGEYGGQFNVQNVLYRFFIPGARDRLIITWLWCDSVMCFNLQYSGSSSLRDVLEFDGIVPLGLAASFCWGDFSFLIQPDWLEAHETAEEWDWWASPFLALEPFGIQSNGGHIPRCAPCLEVERWLKDGTKNHSCICLDHAALHLIIHRAIASIYKAPPQKWRDDLQEAHWKQYETPIFGWYCKPL